MLIVIMIIFILHPGYSGDVNINEAIKTNDENIIIGQSCKRDYACIKNAYCQLQKVCTCDETYAHDLSMSVCHATAGTTCDNHDDCKTMSNAECIQSSCVCMNNYILDVNNSSNCIIRPRKPLDHCQRNDECIEALDKAHCVNEKCRCKSGYKFANQTAKCFEAKGIYQPCKHDYECYDETRPNALHCPNGECVYKDGAASGSGLKIYVHLLILGLSCLRFLNSL